MRQQTYLKEIFFFGFLHYWISLIELKKLIWRNINLFCDVKYDNTYNYKLVMFING